MCEYECGFDDVADPARAGGDMPQRAPTPGEHGEPTFAQTPQTPQQSVVGTVVGIEYLAVGGLADRGEHTDARTAVTTVGSPAAAAAYNAPNTCSRAAVRSCTDPGSTSDTHSGNPLGADSA